MLSLCCSRKPFLTRPRQVTFPEEAPAHVRFFSFGFSLLTSRSIFQKQRLALPSTIHVTSATCCKELLHVTFLRRALHTHGSFRKTEHVFRICCYALSRVLVVASETSFCSTAFPCQSRQHSYTAKEVYNELLSLPPAQRRACVPCQDSISRDLWLHLGR